MPEPSPSQPSHAAPCVTVSVVSHGQGRLVRQVLTCLDNACAGRIAKAVVTVNIPEATDLTDLRFAFPVEVVLNQKPHGFGANHNAAFQRCASEWFLVLNPDIAFAHDPIAPLLGHAAPDVGLLAPRIVEPGKQAPEPHRGLLTPAEVLLRHLLGPGAPASPEWVAGMFMLVRAEAFRQVNGFDPRYFMYVEDADICARLRLAGWRLVVADEVSVLHEAQRASRRRMQPLLWHASSLINWWASAAFWRRLGHSRRIRP